MRSVGFYQEALVLLWHVLTLNSNFTKRVVERHDTNEFLLSLMYLLQQARASVHLIGLLHTASFVLLVLSSERAFAVRLNDPYVAKKVPLEIPAFHGNHADVFALSLYKVISESLPKTQNDALVEMLLTALCNVSPYVKCFCLESCLKLVSLVERLSRPSYLFRTPFTHHGLLFLVEMLNNIVQYQYEGNTMMVYAILRQAEAFSKMEKLSLADSKKAGEETSKVACVQIAAFEVAVYPSNNPLLQHQSRSNFAVERAAFEAREQRTMGAEASSEVPNEANEKESSAGPAEPAEPAEPAASDGGAGLGVFEALSAFFSGEAEDRPGESVAVDPPTSGYPEEQSQRTSSEPDDAASPTTSQRRGTRRWTVPERPPPPPLPATPLNALALASHTERSGGRPGRRSSTWYGQSPMDLGGPPNFQDDDPLPRPAVTEASEPDPDCREEGPLSLSTRVEYSAMPKGATMAVFGLVTVQAAQAAPASADAQSGESTRKPMDLVCVLDVSGSMGASSKMDDLKAAVRFIIQESTSEDRLSLVTFQSHAARRLPLRRMDRAGQDKATVATLRMSSGGGTRIASGLELGLQILEQRRQRNKVCAILLLTDGQDGSCRGPMSQLLQRASKMGCGIYPFGFGSDHDSVLLRDISERAKTPFTYVEETSTIKEAFAGVVGGLSSIVAQRVQLTLTCPARLKEINTPFEVRREGDQKAIVTIPDIFAEERRDLLVELEVSANAEETVLLEACARYLAVREQEVLVQTPVVTMTVQRVDEPQPEMEPDSEVYEQRQRWEVSQVMELASRSADQGQLEEARELLRSKRRTLAGGRSTVLTEALTVELEDAESRMRNLGSWTLGSAEVRDAMTMHQMQRTTNMTASMSWRGGDEVFEDPVRLVDPSGAHPPEHRRRLRRLISSVACGERRTRTSAAAVRRPRTCTHCLYVGPRDGTSCHGTSRSVNSRTSRGWL
ncbi:unnamed protein product [Durusdinium trenchii]|uniref:VWFA domain-containing protein n=1 Tax=Durusdinium trenchii TaxID=1381693 RepID=A0ABP0I0H1_9DINO